MGGFCALITYLIVIVVQIGFIRIGVWEGLVQEENWAYINTSIFMTTCFLIFWSHFKCMTTEPGVIPKKLKTLNYKRLPDHMKQIILQLAWRVQNLQDSIKADSQKTKTDKKNKGKKTKDGEEDEIEPPPVVDYIHKKDLKNLSKGAEDTSSPEEDDSDEYAEKQKRRTGFSTSMERSIKRLLRATLKEKKTPSDKSEGSDDDIVGKDGKITFDRRKFDLDMYVDILRCLHNLEFGPQEKKKDGEECAFKIEQGKPGEPSIINYNDLLQSQEIAQLESII